MKRKIFSIFFALALVLSFSLVTAVPAGAANGTTYEALFVEYDPSALSGRFTMLGGYTDIYNGGAKCGGIDADYEFGLSSGPDYTGWDADHTGTGFWDDPSLGWFYERENGGYTDAYSSTEDTDSGYVEFEWTFSNVAISEGYMLAVTVDDLDDYVAKKGEDWASVPDEWGVYVNGSYIGDLYAYDDTGSDDDPERSINVFNVGNVSGSVKIEINGTYFDLLHDEAYYGTDYGGYASWGDTASAQHGIRLEGLRLAPVVNADTGEGFSSIQAAIDASNPYDTINVATGRYQENLASWKDMEITKSLSLIGAGSGATVIELSEGKTNGVEIRGMGLDVTIEGLTFTKNPASSSAASFNLRIGETGSTFNTLVLRDVEVAYASGRNVFMDGNATYSNVTVENSSFHHSGAWGFSARGTIIEMAITNSDFEHNGWDDPDHGIGFDIDMPIAVSTLTVEGGNFSHNSSKGINLTNTTNASFTDITANDNGGAPKGGFGVSLWEWAEASQNLVFNNPTLTNNTMDGFLIGAQDKKTVSGVTINGGTLKDNGRGGLFIYNYAPSPGQIENVKIVGADIFGNTEWGVFTNTTPVVDATNNWWGHASGPEQVATNPGGKVNPVSDNVLFSPWLYKSQEEFVSGEPCYAGSIVIGNEATEVEPGSYAGGWNTFSAPILLDSSADSVSELLALTAESGLEIVRAQRFDLASQSWVTLVMGGDIITDYQITPGEGFFIQVSTKGSLPILCSMEPLPPQSRDLSLGWNLVGAPSYDSKLVEDALVSLGATCTVVNSPGANPASWSYPPAAGTKKLLPGRAYWVAMSADGTLMCFDSTPVADDMIWELNH